MSRRKSEKDSSTSCHNEAAEADEVYSGYLCKSPPSSLIKNKKAWKRRFFVLSKTKDSSHELKYYKTTERDSHIKSIVVSTITKLYMRPESHSTFEWICKNFGCSSSSVLFMKAEDPKEKAQREYIFIGDTSEEVERWFNALSGILKNIKSESQTEPQIKAKSNSSDQNLRDTDKTKVDNQPQLPPKKSASKVVTTQYGPCSQPPKNSPSATQVYTEMNKEEMSSRQSVTSSEGSLLDCVTKALNSLTQQTESDSETHTIVEKEICVSHRELKNLIFTEEEGKPCVSECQQIQDSCPFQKGDQILAVNDLLTDTVEEMHRYLKRLSKDEVKLTIRRLSLHSSPSEPC
ncbi:pleckstrin homology domain-containing family S member 1 [Pimephales promelas]|uniref:pleckstrin homology domain-containing family S member 1 n=1 Tax=Pimephales promelas TaxID=90988 RepID=UPI0019559216|nr:pleckstrin homology domain-containing family S member 1 [Pimephales promelas]XP_039520946.1 pleckstrin homology domain-containing family S member 1 [Pimephales promelas]